MIKIAIYDVDYTIISNNSLSSFMFFVLKKYPQKILFFPIFMILTLLWLPRVIRTKKLKEYFLVIINKMKKEKVDSLCKEFFERKIVPFIKEGAIENIESNRKDGYKIVIATASFEIYIKFLSEYLNADHYVGTKIRFLKDNITNKIKGKNCKGKEKISRILKIIPEETIKKENSISFTDSKADMPFLNLSSRLFKLTRKKWKIKKIIYNTKFIFKNENTVLS